MIEKTTFNVIGVSQTRVSLAVGKNKIQAIASTHLDQTTGQWVASVQLSSPVIQEGFIEDQLDALKLVVNEAVDEARRLQLARQGTKSKAA